MPSHFLMTPRIGARDHFEMRETNMSTKSLRRLALQALACVSLLAVVGVDALAPIKAQTAQPSLRAKEPKIKKLKAKKGSVDGDFKRKVKERIEEWPQKTQDMLAIQGEIEKHTNVTDRQARALEQVWSELREDRLRSYFCAALRTTLSNLTEPETVVELLDDVLAEETSNQIRIAYMRSFMKVKPEGYQEYLKILAPCERPTVRLLAIEALGRDGDAGNKDPVLTALKDGSWRVRKAAIEAAAKIASKNKDDKDVWDACVWGMIQVLGNPTEGVLRNVVQSRLKEVTKEDFGTAFSGWEKWWEARKKGVTLSAEEKKALYKDASESKGTDWGISSESKRLVYVIDISDSMTREIPKDEREITGRGAKDEEPEGIEWESIKIRLDLAKNELIKTLKKKPADAKFTIVAFNDKLQYWKPEIVEANDKNKEEAIEWVKALKPSGQTNIFGSIEMAIGMAESALDDADSDAKDGKKKKKKRGKDDEVIEDNVPDTIFFLTDGFATAGKYKTRRPDEYTAEDEKQYRKDMKAMLEEIDARNSVVGMTIHCVGISKDHDKPTLRDLAKLTGGVYRPLAMAKR